MYVTDVPAEFPYNQLSAVVIQRNARKGRNARVVAFCPLRQLHPSRSLRTFLRSLRLLPTCLRTFLALAASVAIASMSGYVVRDYNVPLHAEFPSNQLLTNQL